MVLRHVDLRSVLIVFVLCITSIPAFAEQVDTSHETSNWQIAANHGLYDDAVQLSQASASNNALRQLIKTATLKKLSEQAQWRAFVHYKPQAFNTWLSQVDSPHFFLSSAGKVSPAKELNATLAALFSSTSKAPLRLTAYCRFVARRAWLEEQLPELSTLVPEQNCVEFDRYVEYLDADVLTLVFPTAHPNSPSSAFGHTLLRIDKKDQRPESRLLNMSLNFAADVGVDVPAAAYAIKGLTGSFEGRFRLLPYHVKLREYGQIENRDTWEYELKLDKPAVDLILRHAYEMLISHYDYYFLSENCSYHLLSLIEVAFPDNPLTDDFKLWTIPVDTIRKLEERQLSKPPRFVPSSIRSLRSRQASLSRPDVALAVQALNGKLDDIDSALNEKNKQEQASILDLLSEYERYSRLKTDPSAQGSNSREMAILSRRSKLGVKSVIPQVQVPDSSPDAGHGTSRLTLEYHHNSKAIDQTAITYRPAYHDLKDPSIGYDNKAAVEMGLISVAHDAQKDTFFLKQFTLINIESIEPRGKFFKPVSWRTSVIWQRPSAHADHHFSFKIGAGLAKQLTLNTPVVFAFAEADVIDNPGFKNRRQLQLGINLGAHWQATTRLRMGAETTLRQQLGGDRYAATTEAWFGFALSEQWSINFDLNLEKVNASELNTQTTLSLRSYL